MAKLFCHEWMQQLAAQWNSDTEMLDSLASAGFNASIGFGYNDAGPPRGVVEVVAGRIEYAGDYSDQELDWDLRAALQDWRDWIEHGFGLDKLGVAIANGRLGFRRGDYRRMIRTPALARPFLRHFELMAKLDTDYVR